MSKIWYGEQLPSDPEKPTELKPYETLSAKLLPNSGKPIQITLRAFYARKSFDLGYTTNDVYLTSQCVMKQKNSKIKSITHTVVHHIETKPAKEIQTTFDQEELFASDDLDKTTSIKIKFAAADLDLSKQEIHNLKEQKDKISASLIAAVGLFSPAAATIASPGLAFVEPMVASLLKRFEKDMIMVADFELTEGHPAGYYILFERELVARRIFLDMKQRILMESPESQSAKIPIQGSKHDVSYCVVQVRYEKPQDCMHCLRQMYKSCLLVPATESGNESNSALIDEIVESYIKHKRIARWLELSDMKVRSKYEEDLYRELEPEIMSYTKGNTKYLNRA